MPKITHVTPPEIHESYSVGDWIIINGPDCYNSLAVISQTAAGLIQAIAISENDANRFCDPIKWDMGGSDYRNLGKSVIEAITNRGEYSIKKVNMHIEVTL